MHLEINLKRTIMQSKVSIMANENTSKIQNQTVFIMTLNPFNVKLFDSESALNCYS